MAARTDEQRAEHEQRWRSKAMASVRSTGTDLEVALARGMWRSGLRGWRRNRRIEGARPDFSFGRHKLAIFVDGCYWHGCPDCAARKTPATNRSYWGPKIARNRERDAQQTSALQSAGWRVLRFWGHDIEHDLERCVADVRLGLRPET